MEKYSQFRDRGSGISPFLPIKTPSTTLSALPRVFIFLFRLPLFIAYITTYFLIVHHLPLPPVLRKLLLWGAMGIPGIWWVDLQLDGVKRGHLASQPPERVPHPGSVIAANFTSPVDAFYLAAVFDPIFTISYPGSRKVKRVGLLAAVWHALSSSQMGTAPTKGLTDLKELVKVYPDRVIVVFPECGTTNGKGILPFSPSLVTVPPTTKIFPVSLRYTPPDITTPIPGAWSAFLWKLLSRPTHLVRVRIAEGMINTSNTTNGIIASDESESASSTAGDVTTEEQLVLDRIAEALARLGRNKRVGLTLRDKASFIYAWKTGRK